MLSFCTVLWGDMVPLYLEATLPSILQPGNLPACRELLGDYFFYASDEARMTVRAHPRYDELEELVDILWLPLQHGQWEVNSNIRHHLERAAEEGCHAALLPPDEVFGNGSLANLAQLTSQGYNPILWGYPKLTPKGFDAVTEALRARGILSNRELVSLAMRHLVGGAYSIDPFRDPVPYSWRVIHRVPAPCLKADDRVLAFWQENPMANGGHDHVLPMWMIKNGYPWFLITHSDAYFQVELSTGWAGFPGCSPRGWLPTVAEEYEAWASQFTEIWLGETDA